MRVKPMIFNTPMVQAILNGNKTTTRRPLSKLQQPRFVDNQFVSTARSGHWGYNIEAKSLMGLVQLYNDPFLSDSPVSVGDLIYVRETFQGPLFNSTEEDNYHNNKLAYHTPDYCIYAASDKPTDYVNLDGEHRHGWKPSIHMPRWASRITLKITRVWMERVQDITEEQAIKEGMPSREEAQLIAIESGIDWYQSPTTWFKNLWDRIYENWSDNPLVWCYEFDVIQMNVDEYLKDNL